MVRGAVITNPKHPPRPPTVSSAMVILAQAIFSIAFAVVTVAAVDFIIWAVS
jgi:hypothetical protein